MHSVFSVLSVRHSANTTNIIGFSIDKNHMCVFVVLFWIELIDKFRILFCSFVRIIVTVFTDVLIRSRHSNEFHLLVKYDTISCNEIEKWILTVILPMDGSMKRYLSKSSFDALRCDRRYTRFQVLSTVSTKKDFFFPKKKTKPNRQENYILWISHSFVNPEYKKTTWNTHSSFSVQTMK